MGTRSLIAMKIPDGYKAIYCHWDGYPNNQMPILKNHYNSQAQVESLIALGDLSCLGKELGEKHDFNTHGKNPVEADWCLAYGRDREEDDTEAAVLMVEDTVGNKHEALIGYAEEMNAEYVYIWDGAWTIKIV